MSQKFQRNDLVRVAADLGPYMKHFTADCDAIVVGSYANQFRGGGDDEDENPSYTLILLPGFHETSWYSQHQLTFLRTLTELEFRELKRNADEAKSLQSTLPWIVENRKQMVANNSVSGSSVAALMRFVGVQNPWGSRGEGATYYAHAYSTMDFLKDELLSGDVDRVVSKIRTANPDFTP